MKFVLVALLLWSPLVAYSQISYNPLSKKEGDSATDVDAQPSLVGKTSTTGNLSYLKVDDTGVLVTTALTGFGSDFSFGDVASATTTEKVVRRTPYTEQTVNAQRSFNSASVSDDGAPVGTGARTLRVTYFNATGAGPFTETLTLDGTTCVATVASNIAFVEHIKVLTVGSTLSNVGIISMFVNSVCGGGTIGTISALNNRTFWAHHYVATGKEANITGISAGSNSTTVGCGAVFILRARTIGIADAVDTQISDFIRLYGQESTFARAYTSPLKIPGPARLVMHVTPECSSAITYRAAIDFYQP